MAEKAKTDNAQVNSAPANDPQQAPVNQELPPQQNEPNEGGFFRDDPAAAASGLSETEAPIDISWMASEFIHHDKSASWYFGLIVIAGAGAAGIYFLTKDIVSSVVVVFAAFFLAYFGSHKPRQLEYRIDSKGVTVGGKFYAFNDFRSFSLVPEGAFNSIVFMPLKRFAVPLSIYYDPRAETQIIDVLKNRLPFEPGQLDMSEKLMRKIRF